MIRLFPQQACDLLDSDALPRTDKTELNYRTRPLTSFQELRLALLVLVAPLVVVVPLAATFSFLDATFSWMDEVVIAIGVVLLCWYALRLATGAVMRKDLIFGFFFSIAGITSVAWEWLDSVGVWSWKYGLLVVWITAWLMARQIAAWILVGPAVDHDRMEQWKRYLPDVFPRGLSMDCPETITNLLLPVLLGPAWWLSIWSADEFFGGRSWLWPLLFPVSALASWLGFHVLSFALIPWPDLHRSFLVTWRGLVTFLTYDVYFTPAAGVFRFPTRWLRHPLARWGFVICVLVLLGFSYSNFLPKPIETWRAGGSYTGQLALNYGMICYSGPAILITVLWFVSGSLLDRFDQELSQHKDSDTSDWDNYVDRIVNSGDKLERRHILAGTSEVGDYPILIHDTIYDMHSHLLGDTGASKTSLGIAPQATQLIARADSSVVIVDLKGDKSLFETCRREAARTKKMRFRWVCNEVGKTTFGFNPFLQSHNRMLTTEQLTQQILQGLSLDYGLRYGAGYFTAMNEIVLNNVLKETGAKSFRELSEKLSDRDWYKTVGHFEDWLQARHLSALVKRLAASEAINIVPGMYADQPEVHQQAIDARELFNEPQVIYLNLRSAVEPTNAPTIARLFLWSLFTAASHHSTEKRRVYFFIDEVQQVISDGMKLIFEQFRDLGGTIIAAHQTAGQLNRQGTDLSDTIDSCTAVKQVFRASDPYSLDRLEKLGGRQTELSPAWLQAYERGEGELLDRYDPVFAREGYVRVSEKDRSRLDAKTVLAVGSRRQSSLIRFTFGSGYTQFAGATVPMVSQYSISYDEYVRRRTMAWPTARGAFEIRRPESEPSEDAVDPSVQGFAEEFDQRAKSSS